MQRILRWLPGLATGVLVAAGLTAAPPQQLAPAAATGSAPQPPTYGCQTPAQAFRNAAPGRGKTVALTFDDGPGASTAALVDILHRQQITASFFNLGAVEINDPARVRSEARDGFALGDHTWSHRDLSLLGAAGQAREIDHARRSEARITGHYTCLLRPPFGNYDATTLRLARERHLTIWAWSVDTEDWKGAGSSARYWVNRIVTRAEAGGTQQHPVVLMHNQTVGNPATVLALPRIIRYYRQHGYRFVDLNGNTGRPAVSRLSASSGNTAGGYPLVVRGANFRNVTAVRFGRVAAPDFTVHSPGRLVVQVPAHRSGRVTVTVRTADHGDSPASAAARFRFEKPTAAAPRARHGTLRRSPPGSRDHF